jgi:hypothetical protein
VGQPILAAAAFQGGVPKAARMPRRQSDQRPIAPTSRTSSATPSK